MGEGLLKQRQRSRCLGGNLEESEGLGRREEEGGRRRWGGREEGGKAEGGERRGKDRGGAREREDRGGRQDGEGRSGGGGQWRALGPKALSPPPGWAEQADKRLTRRPALG